ncbi:adenosine deaminase [Arthrobacter sp. B2a2-09]|uniref:adenosine deaminase n=1 Tax=Arthrobacter sp. B2a2-09 TaxID=2952822 RepID=UPI0022CD7611|nr:adenosine deaminase [Arthrobacter sp. B2a2-09]MCZ9882279.1 adenosine deaminase [Arthrobacter sp. B2a2-09]
MDTFSATPHLATVRTTLRSLPKVSLHDHLDGGLRPETIIELADEANLSLPFKDGAKLGAWIAEQSNAGSLSAYLKPFHFTGAVTQTRDSLVRVAREFVQDLAEDGVVYGEIRWAPENHQRRGLSLDEAVDAVQEGIQAGTDDVEASGKRIRIGQLITAMRHDSRANEIAQLAIRHKNHGVVGFDIAGAEAGFPASKHAEAFDYLAASLLPVTVHAGEGDGLDSIRSALLHGRALRLGHGVRLAEDIAPLPEEAGTGFALGDLAQWVRDRQITLEMSPSSNVQTGAIARWGTQLTDHPFDLLYRLGFRVTVNTDNRLMSNTTLTKELALLMNAFNYGFEDIKAFQMNAATAAFLPVEDREDLKDVIRTGFAAGAELSSRMRKTSRKLVAAEQTQSDSAPPKPR